MTEPLPTDASFGLDDGAAMAGALVGDTIAASRVIKDDATLTLDAARFTSAFTAFAPTGEGIPILDRDEHLNLVLGGSVTVTGSGFEPDTPVGVYLGRGILLGTARATQNGSYRCTGQIGRHLAEGRTVLTVVGQIQGTTDPAYRGSNRAAARVRASILDWTTARIDGMDLNPSMLALTVGETEPLDAIVW